MVSTFAFHETRNPAAARMLIGAAAVALSCTLLLPSAAWAADQPPAANEPDTTIYVTARKRTERIQDIPDSIKAFTADAIVSANIQNVKDVAVRVPNVSIVEAQQPGVALINIRGVGQARNGESPVAVVVDGVQLSSANQITQDLFDIERVEVLKGPQGAVYGRNAIGGAINIITRQPTNDFEGFLQGGYGTGDDVRLSASVSGPIIDDKLLFRVAGSFRNFDGDIDSLNTPGRDKVNWQKDRNVRGMLLAKPTEALTIDLRYSRLETRAGAAFYAPVESGTSINQPLPYIGNFPGHANRILNDFSAKADLDLGGATLTSITALSKVSSFLAEDLDFTPLDQTSAEQRLKTNNLSQELRIVSPQSGAFKWLGGVYYLRTRQTLDTKVFAGADLLPLLGLPSSLAPLLFSTTKARDRNNAYAAFGQLSYRFATGIELTGALRYDIDQRHQTDLVAAGQPEYRNTFRSLQPKASVSWFINPDAMIYATVGKGFRSGGFNPQARISRNYKKEENWNFEAGFKTSLLDRRLSLNGAAFYTRIKDRQVYILDVINSAQTLINPIPKAEVYGLEAELSARPVRNLDLSASIGVTGSKILSYDSSVLAGLPAAGDFKGNHLPQVAGVSYALSGQYRIPLANDMSLTPRVELNGSGGAYYWEIDNLDKRGSITLVNARLTLSYRKLSVTVFAENLFKDRYVLEFVPKEWSGASNDFSAAAPGRRVGVKARFDF
ncbi:TonB-dependent receptor [Flavisphingomonas formosensis]|uniref:TonB-dependent receptor n=1 Tax=Flavisphingomonas formosensis TaxID=861534 RepID=UPI001E404159|nr:TonB-dependent receptor [Sphingomonas formosensis]